MDDRIAHVRIVWAPHFRLRSTHAFASYSIPARLFLLKLLQVLNSCLLIPATGSPKSCENHKYQSGSLASDPGSFSILCTRWHRSPEIPA
jgi:hypothetical protein